MTYDDIRHASELMCQYPGTKLDMVDCCIVALAERLHITRVATLDRHDFLRLRNGSSLDIVP